MGHLQDIFIDVSNMLTDKLTHSNLLEIQKYIYDNYKYNITKQEVEFIMGLIK